MTAHQNGRRQTKRCLATQNRKRPTEGNCPPCETHSIEIECQATTTLHTADFPEPQVLSANEQFIWDKDASLVENYIAIGKRLASAGDIYRDPQHGAGLFLASSCPIIQPRPITKGSELAQVIADRVRICVIKKGSIVGNMPASSDLNTMLGAEIFLQQFRPLDKIVNVPMYLPDFTLTTPGYNDGGLGNRVYYCGPSATSSELGHDAITQFLDVMQFASDADRTNTVAAALTVMLRNHWPGAKPLLAVTSSKSHGGKETIIEFAAGRTPHVSVSYESTDWALQKNFASMVSRNADVGLINIENVRLEGNEKVISSSFLERLLTDPNPAIFSTGSGDPRRRKNDLIAATSTNFGQISEDLLNRALPIRLVPIGDVATRRSPIGNPKLEYLPKNRERIEAELRGMIQRWKDEDRPLDETIMHPFSDWARTIGGILKANGFDNFLQNYGSRKTQDDPMKLALGLVGVKTPEIWRRPVDWVLTVQELGLTKRLIPSADRESLESRQRALGTLFSAHREETFTVETEEEVVVLRLQRARRRFDSEQPHTRYRFTIVERKPLAEDEDPADALDPTPAPRKPR